MGRRSNSPEPLECVVDQGRHRTPRLGGRSRTARNEPWHLGDQALGDTQDPPGIGTSRADQCDPMLAPNRRTATAEPDGARKSLLPLDVCDFEGDG